MVKTARAEGPPKSIFAPLRLVVFRRIWAASLLSNFGLLIMGVGAAWSMTQMTASANMVALVQTASMLPVALVSLAAGAIADMYDRRRVAMAALTIGLTGALAMTILAMINALTPVVLLALCFTTGTGMALFGPAWQASVSEQVPSEDLAAAVALNGISYNIARSFGPAIGGVIVATVGSAASFGANALLYVPLMIVLFLWRRPIVPSRLPPERLGRAIISGIRYVLNSPSIRVVLARTLVTGIAGSAILALMPLIARDLLSGGAQLYGLLLGSFGLGAVLGALNIGRLRAWLSGEASVRLCALVMGTGIALVSLSRWPVVTGLALVFVGAAWTLSVTIFNVGVQMSAPRWVAGRALAAFQAAIAGGVAIGSWGWGSVANSYGIENALLAAGAFLLASPVLSRWLRMPPTGGRNETALEVLADPELRLSLSARSGPIVVEIEYRVDPAKARLFYAVMQHIQLVRQRNGAYGWSIARDIADPELWTERYHCPTWHDYLRQRNRSTQSERELQDRAYAFHLGPEPVRIRRMLERPVGSVRWKDSTPDGAACPIEPVTGATGGLDVG
jgi:MFS family permease